MRTLVLSDLHLGQGTRARSADRTLELAALLRALGAAPLRVILNGDAFDFVAGASERDADALGLARAFVDEPASAGLLRALGGIVDAGGELILRTGEDDAELADPRLQEAVIAGLRASRSGRRRVAFVVSPTPAIFAVGGAKVVVSRALGLRRDDETRRLAARALNRLRRQYGVGLAAYLIPDYVGATLAALAVNPTAAMLALRLDEAGVESSVDVGPLLAEAALEGEALRVFGDALDPAVVLAPEDYPRLDEVRLRLFQLCLRRRPPIGEGGLRRLGDDERARCLALAAGHGAAAVLVAYSHVPGWRDDGEIVVVDTGGWCPTIEAPEGGGEAAWRRTLEAWERLLRIELVDPALVARAGLRRRLTAALVEPLASGSGARLALVEWRGARELVRAREVVIGGGAQRR